MNDFHVKKLENGLDELKVQCMKVSSGCHEFDFLAMANNECSNILQNNYKIIHKTPVQSWLEFYV